MNNLTHFDPNYFLEQQGSLFPYEAQILDEVVWDSLNVLGIPDLDVTMQADKIIEPMMTWGEIARTSEMLGTYNFYTDDYKFENLWKNPNKLIQSGCAVAIEVNFPAMPRLPLIAFLYSVFRKRWLSRYWQSQGVKVIVDVSVALRYTALNLLGVPKGWKNFCTRVHKNQHDRLEKQYNYLCEEYGSDINFIVIGGMLNGYAHRLCLERQWIWYPDKMNNQRIFKKQQDQRRQYAKLQEYF